MQASPAVRISRDRFHLAWDPAIEPIETIESGAVVEFDLLDASGGQITAASTVDDLARLDFDRVDQVNGPIAVVGAEPGDTLQIELLEFEPADWGWTASIPGFGLLAEDFPDPALRITRVPAAGGRAEFLPGVRVPIVPFCGEIGVAPIDGPRSTIPPDLHGGNMDTRHLTAGSTLFLPVFHAGGRLSMGDGHAAQGDGEVSGTAIECPLDGAELRFDVRDDLTLRMPIAWTDRAWITFGFDPDLDVAADLALQTVLDLIEREYGVSRDRALALASVCVDLRVTQVVNESKGVHAVLRHDALQVLD
jgi:acetamidase/formamidase